MLVLYLITIWTHHKKSTLLGPPKHCLCPNRRRGPEYDEGSAQSPPRLAAATPLVGGRARRVAAATAGAAARSPAGRAAVAAVAAVVQALLPAGGRLGRGRGRGHGRGSRRAVRAGCASADRGVVRELEAAEPVAPRPRVSH